MYREGCEKTCVIKGIIYPLNSERLRKAVNEFQRVSHFILSVITLSIKIFRRYYNERRMETNRGI